MHLLMVMLTRQRLTNKGFVQAHHSNRWTRSHNHNILAAKIARKPFVFYIHHLVSQQNIQSSTCLEIHHPLGHDLLTLCHSFLHIGRLLYTKIRRVEMNSFSFLRKLNQLRTITDKQSHDGMSVRGPMCVQKPICSIVKHYDQKYYKQNAMRLRCTTVIIHNFHSRNANMTFLA